jgi:hypothetical protein
MTRLVATLVRNARLMDAFVRNQRFRWAMLAVLE